MKKVKKDQRIMGQRFVAGIVLICVLAVAVCFGAKVWQKMSDEMDRINWNAGMALHGGQADETYREASVSDDGKWFLVPEVRIKFPYFWAESVQINDIGEESRSWGMWPLRYAPIAWQHGGDEGFQVNFTFHAFAERWGEACVDPFRIAAYDPDRTSLHYGDEYEIVAELSLADGRVVKLMQRSSGSSECLKFTNSNAGQMMADSLGKLESY